MRSYIFEKIVSDPTVYRSKISKSLYISRAVINVYGTGIEFWAGFWPFGNNEKKVWADY